MGKDAVNAFKEEIKPFTEGIANVEIEVACQIGAGCAFDPIKNVVPIAGGDPVALEHKAGEVWLVDFWATWCPPCQAPMQHNQKMLENHGDWEGKVRIIGVSLDQDIPTIQTRVNDKGWNKVEHYWRNGNGFESWEFKGIPHVALMDKEGKIVYKGHPGQGNLEEAIGKLI